jgi:hypothetical protein
MEQNGGVSMPRWLRRFGRWLDYFLSKGNPDLLPSERAEIKRRYNQPI